MAVVEATINAFEHSGASDRRVSIHFHVLGPEHEPEGLQITVSDSGVGITDQEIKKSRADDEPAKLPRKRGHGLRIISGLMDKVDIQSNPQGTTVVMTKLR